MNVSSDAAFIDGQARSVRDMMLTRKYGLDFYQREYDWNEGNVTELINDLADAFGRDYDPQHEREAVASYRPYFLGTIVTSDRGGVRYLIDGQQRITTLSLLILHLNELSRDREGVADLPPLVYSEKYGKKSFNLNVEQRNAVMAAILNGETYDPAAGDQSSVNIWSRYGTIVDRFPRDLAGEPLLHFIDWLLERVILVEIVAADEDMGVEIFETMNDRGLQLTNADMLKSYLVSRVRTEEIEATNNLWRQRMEALRALDANADAEFLKTWLRSKYAQTIRQRKKDAVALDFDKIGTAFHKWVRDNRKLLGLEKKADFQQLIDVEFERLSRRYMTLLEASQTLDPRFPAVYYNARNGFTLQFLPIMAAVTASDDDDTFEAKARLVSGYLDLMIARRMVNNRSIGYSTLQYAMFLLARDLRDLDTDAVRQVLADRVANLEEGFDSMSRFSLNGQNRSHVAYLLARMTDWIEGEHGQGFVEYMSRDRRTQFEVEHIWANKPDRHTDEFPDPRDFADARNLFGALLLLPKDFNASYNDATYAKKIAQYATQNLLAASLNPVVYTHNPTFTRLIKEHALPFKPHPEAFTYDTIKERQDLYQRLCETIWDPEHLGLEGGTPTPKTKGKNKHFDISIQEVMENSDLRPGPLVFANLKWPGEGTLNADGSITVGDTTVPAPSKAAALISPTASNGWYYWATQAPDGTIRRFEEYRDQALRNLGRDPKTGEPLG